MQNKDWQTSDVKNLCETLSSIREPKVMMQFMRDVATITELTEMAKRWKAAQLINQQESYRSISEKTGLSTTTVARVAYWIQNGTGGYVRMLNHHHSH